MVMVSGIDLQNSIPLMPPPYTYISKLCKAGLSAVPGKATSVKMVFEPFTEMGLAAVTETIAATGHSWGAWTITKDPTQTETGTAERVCQNDSNHTDSTSIPALSDTDTWTKGEYKAPTCEDAGSQVYTSSYGTVTETIAATGHSWGAWTITKDPTQTETGTAERVCQNDSNHKDSTDIPVLTDSTWTKGQYTAPTCEDAGSQVYTSSYGTVTETIAATGHTFEWIIDTEATTEAPGVKHEECTKCHVKRNENTEIPQLPV